MSTCILIVHLFGRKLSLVCDNDIVAQKYTDLFTKNDRNKSTDKKKLLFLAVFERLWLCKTSFGFVEVKTDIVLDIKLNADYDSDIILGHKMNFFLNMVEIMSKIAVFDRFLAVSAQNFQNFPKKMSFSNS